MNNRGKMTSAKPSSLPADMSDMSCPIPSAEISSSSDITAISCPLPSTVNTTGYSKLSAKSKPVASPLSSPAKTIVCVSSPSKLGPSPIQRPAILAPLLSTSNKSSKLSPKSSPMASPLSSPEKNFLCGSSPGPCKPGPSPIKRPATPTKCPAPAKAPRVTLEDYTASLQSFKDDMDTRFKAVLYSVMVGEKQSATEDLNKTRRVTNAFLSQSLYTLKQLMMNTAALQQKLAKTDQYNIHLHRENNELRQKIKNLKKEIELKELDNCMLRDSSVFEKDFEEEGTDKEDEPAQTKVENYFEEEGSNKEDEPAQKEGDKDD